jgi:signal transduction histidine kinase
MKKLLLLYKPVRDFFVRHPAVLSGYIIYAYFFITTMGFYRDLKESHFKNFNIVERFDALIWMWLLAVALVKIIEYRSRINEQQRIHLEHQKELEVKKAQLSTAHEMIRALQHQINNPLTIILLYIQRAVRQAEAFPELQESLTRVKEGAERIATTLREYSTAQGIESVESPVGRIAKPLHNDDQSRTVDETGAS